MTKPLTPGFYVVSVAGGFTIPVIVDHTGDVWTGTRMSTPSKTFALANATKIEPDEFIDLLPEHKVQRLEEPKADADKPAAPVEYDNGPLLPYLRQIHDNGGLKVEWTDTHWPEPKKVRQSLYIARLVEKRDGELVLTDKGRTLVNG